MTDYEPLILKRFGDNPDAAQIARDRVAMIQAKQPDAGPAYISKVIAPAAILSELAESKSAVRIPSTTRRRWRAKGKHIPIAESLGRSVESLGEDGRLLRGEHTKVDYTPVRSAKSQEFYSLPIMSDLDLLIEDAEPRAISAQVPRTGPQLTAALRSVIEGRAQRGESPEAICEYLHLGPECLNTIKFISQNFFDAA